jgi:hypothetical protein
MLLALSNQRLTAAGGINGEAEIPVLESPRPWGTQFSRQPNSKFYPNVERHDVRGGHLWIYWTRVWSVIQFTSQVLPPSSVNACSKWGTLVSVFDQINRMKISLSFNVSWA